MDGLDTGLAQTTNTASAPPVPSTADTQPQSVDSIFDSAVSELTAGDSASPTPAPPDTPATTPAPATTEPPQKVDGTSAEPAPESKGPIPFERHKSILENARTEAAKEAETRVMQQYAPQLQVVQRLQADPVGTVTQLINELQQHPEYGQQLRSYAGRMLAGKRGTPPAPTTQAEAEPGPDIWSKDEHGREIALYSAEGLAKREAWLMKRLEQQFGEKFKPALDIAQERQKQQQQQQIVSMAMEGYKPYIAALQKLPGFIDHKQAIVDRQHELMREHVGTDPVALLFQAYADVVPAKLQQAQQQLVAQQQQSLVQQAGQKLAASSHNPAASATASPRTISVNGRSHDRVLDEIFEVSMAEVAGR